jgi:hypothetical protein
MAAAAAPAARAAPAAAEEAGAGMSTHFPEYTWSATSK